MGRLIVILTAVLVLSASSARAADTVPGQVLVRYEGADAATVVRVADAERAITKLERSDRVAYAEPVYRTSAQATVPNAGVGDQWHLRDATQIARGWNLAGAGDASVLVANVDSGVNLSHPALAGAALWRNAGEIPGNGIDDDGDGCVDDVHGCDFIDGDGDPADSSGHGTATAGVVSATWDAGVKYAGVAPGTSLIVARALDATGHGTTASLAAALDYVTDRGARVVNLSISGPPSEAVADVIAEHPDALFVAAAGNAGTDADVADSYPCVDPAPNVLCVGATDQSGALAPFSNFSADSVDLAAPGTRIATLNRTGYSNGWSGTSIAAPIVAGVAALGFSAAPGATVARVKAALLGSVAPSPSLAGTTVSGGRLDAYAALAALTGRTDAPVPASEAPATTDAPAPVAVATGTLQVASTARTVKGRKAIAVQLTCTGTAGCSGTLGVAGSKRAARYTLGAGGKATLKVPVKLTKKRRSVALVTTARGVSARVVVKLAKR